MPRSTPSPQLGKFPGMNETDYTINGCGPECENSINAQVLVYIKNFATPNALRIITDIVVLGVSARAGLLGLVVGGAAAIEGMASVAVTAWGIGEIYKASALATAGCPQAPA